MLDDSKDTGKGSISISLIYPEGTSNHIPEQLLAQYLGCINEQQLKKL